MDRAKYLEVVSDKTCEVCGCRLAEQEEAHVCVDIRETTPEGALWQSFDPKGPAHWYCVQHIRPAKRYMLDGTVTTLEV